MKYKRLTPEELNNLEKEFISFLAHAQITAQDWEKMKIQENEKANELIDVFSDVVYDKVLKKIEYLEYREAKSLHIYKFTSEEIKLLGIKVKEGSKIDLTKNDLNQQDFSAVTILKSNKKYQKEREVEIFELLQAGCLITNNALFNTLEKLI